MGVMNVLVVLTSDLIAHIVKGLTLQLAITAATRVPRPYIAIVASL